jgi:hypothetical protein
VQDQDRESNHLITTDMITKKKLENDIKWLEGIVHRLTKDMSDAKSKIGNLEARVFILRNPPLFKPGDKVVVIFSQEIRRKGTIKSEAILTLGDGDPHWEYKISDATYPVEECRIHADIPSNPIDPDKHQ